MARPKVVPEKTIEQKAEEYTLLQQRWAKEDVEEQMKVQARIAAEDAEKKAKAEAQKQAEIEARKNAAKKAYEAYLKKPLTPDEEVEYERYLAMANSNRTPPDAIMKKLAEFRIRQKNNGVKNPA
jgi:actin-related protein